MSRKRSGFTLAGLVLILVVASSAWAASEKVLYAFHGNDGGFGGSVIVGPDGKLYGTTVDGGKMNVCPGDAGLGCGVAFGLTRGGSGKWHEAVLHAFDGADGYNPVGGLVLDKAGNLYGATVYGGSLDGCSGLGCGVVFQLTPGADGEWAEKVLHKFDVTDGAWPFGGLIFDSAGNLYGTTSIGGNTSGCNPPEGCGLVFELSPDGGGSWTETVLYSFSAKDGAMPNAPLIFDSAGYLYGTAQWGGAYDAGTVFKLSPGRDGQWNGDVLHSFSSDTKDGGQPTCGLIFDSLGNLYGTTRFGGTKGQQGWGTAFKLTPGKNGKWAETALHRFDEYKIGGGNVDSGLLLDDQGNLYGTAASGGKYTCPGSGDVACGVVFRLTPHANGRWTETVLHSFGKAGDGAGPGGLVTDSAGHLFGVTAEGGYVGGVCGKYPYTGCGVVYEVAP